MKTVVIGPETSSARRHGRPFALRLLNCAIGPAPPKPCARQQVSVQGRTVNHRERALPLARGNSFICENKVICGLPFLGRHRGCRAFWMKTKGNLDDATKS